MTEVSVDMTELTKVLTKLLDKAGKDPRLTPRILREKAEQRMSMEKGNLKVHRKSIKDLIWEWWEKDQKKEEEALALNLKLLIKIAKVSGSGPQMFKGLSDHTIQQKIVALRERLREKGLVFSNIPTIEEIEAIQKAYEAKKDLQGLDQSLIIDAPRKRKSEGDTSEPTETKKHKSANSPSVTASKHAAAAAVAAAQPVKRQYSKEEDEAEF